MQNKIKKIPWDSKVFGLDAFEIVDTSDKNISDAIKNPGHYTIKVDPTFSREVLHRNGFYYCSTLVEPYCKANCFIFHEDKSVSLSTDADIVALEPLMKGIWQFDRFHKDFNIDPELADQRYINWLYDLIKSNSVLTLRYNEDIAGFFAFDHNKIVLHALSTQFKGKGLAKMFWSAACRKLFNKGYQELTSSISISNILAVNLYYSLGFKLRHPKDVYHRLVKDPSKSPIAQFAGTPNIWKQKLNYE